MRMNLEEKYQGTLTFNEEVNGWTSFFSFEPDYMVALNGKFYTFKDGLIYEHNSPHANRNNFYGVQYGSQVGVVFNDNPSTEKMFKSIMLESNSPWHVSFTGDNNVWGDIYKAEFEKKKNRYFAYTRRNEDYNDVTTFATNGIGRLKSFSGNSLFFNKVGDLTNKGDKLTQLQNGRQTILGYIDSVNRQTNEIVLQQLYVAPIESEYCFSSKWNRFEGGEIRGCWLRADLYIDTTDFAELFAITANVAESYV
jgi:hypothetical protein